MTKNKKTESRAAATEVSVDVVIAAVLSQLGGIFALNQEKMNGTECFSLWQKMFFALLMTVFGKSVI